MWGWTSAWLCPAAEQQGTQTAERSPRAAVLSWFLTVAVYSVVEARAAIAAPRASSSNPRSKPKKASKSHAAAAAPHVWAAGQQCLAR